MDHDHDDEHTPSPPGASQPPQPHHHHEHEEQDHGLGETEEQHAAHSKIPAKIHWGLPAQSEAVIFYCLAVPSWCLQICAAVLGSLYHTSSASFIGTMSAFLVLYWAAWFQTAIAMVQRASWIRDEVDLENRRRYLYLAVRLNRLQLPTATISLVTFIQAYARRFDLDDLAYWLLFLLSFIWSIVFAVMNAYNNITWETDRLAYEDHEIPYGNRGLAILGIPSKPLLESQGNWE